ncbi:nitrate ABC transporter ATP-binding protein [Trichothermofontia sichuanensis B231]|uniref:ABC transporter ATP-binding/substrate-binding protein n=1 Tax=Trichothermofontia sichuanensis TaxID=3045816 RepID=UPI0022451E13|nr:nitrate ABC transporter ATP-binding protein [Trichothermofontia sichuanensis]UZQ53654.1 nitrate ABC transporter ATP-binding protein [Trichothermofontia sichuanensis B231]
MVAFLEIDHVDKIFPLPDGGRYVAIENVSFKIQQGEFVSLIGHSGCGKSTLLNMVAGLERPTAGGVILEGREVRQPGPDRMVVFQNYSLLPWKTVRQNIALAVNSVLRHLPKGERRGVVEAALDLVHLRPAADKYPAQLSGGMKQRVAIARALALRPKVLLLDEPFGALDALTRGNLQAQLMQICQESQVTCLMVTHDVDEALLLSDRVIMLTNGPSAHIGQILEVDIPRPRRRLEVVEHPSYYSLRSDMVYFLDQQKRASRRQRRGQVIQTGTRTGAVQSQVTLPVATRMPLEKNSLDLGFIPLTDCAPIVVAQEKGFFAQQGLEVTLHRKPNWRAIAQGVINGELDAAQMVAGMPLALTLDPTAPAPVPIVTALTLSRNGNAITFNRSLLKAGIHTLGDLKAAIARDSDRTYTFGMVHPASMHNLLLRYWLAEASIDPDSDVRLSILPPPQMAVYLKSGKLDGYCVGEPWNSRAVYEETGYVMATDLDLWDGHPEKVLGVREDWAMSHPHTHVALVKALIQAGEYCDRPEHREEILTLLCQPQYVGSAPAYTRPGFLDPYDRGTGEAPQLLSGYNRFFQDHVNQPDRGEMLWILTQLNRWGITPFPSNWSDVLDRLVHGDIFNQAMQELGHSPLDRGPSKPGSRIALFSGPEFTPDRPLEYINAFAIKHPDAGRTLRVTLPTAAVA